MCRAQSVDKFGFPVTIAKAGVTGNRVHVFRLNFRRRYAGITVFLQTCRRTGVEPVLLLTFSEKFETIHRNEYYCQVHPPRT